MKRYTLIALLIAYCHLGSYAGNPVWNNGHVTLSNGQRISGQLSYNWKAEVLQVRTADGIMKAYSAQKVNSFAYFDMAQNTVRKFDAIDLPVSSESSRIVFLEECTLGYFTVYRRLRHAKELIKVTRPSLYQDDPQLIKDLDNFVYFVIDADGHLTDLHQFEATVWPKMMSEYRPQLTEYMQVRQLDPALTASRLMLINHFNFLRENYPSLANRSAIVGAD